MLKLHATATLSGSPGTQLGKGGTATHGSVSKSVISIKHI